MTARVSYDKAWGNPCRRGHVNDEGKTLRYQRMNSAGVMESGNCVECNRAQRPKYKENQRLRYATDPEYAEAVKARARAHAKRLTATGHTRARVKGMTLAQLNAMYEAQDHKCAVCQRPEAPEPRTAADRLHIDHDHACCPGDRACGACIRGLLCQPCNHALGNLGDSLERIMALAAYVQNWK